MIWKAILLCKFMRILCETSWRNAKKCRYTAVAVVENIGIDNKKEQFKVCKYCLKTALALPYLWKKVRDLKGER